MIEENNIVTNYRQNKEKYSLNSVLLLNGFLSLKDKSFIPLSFFIDYFKKSLLETINGLEYKEDYKNIIIQFFLFFKKYVENSYFITEFLDEHLEIIFKDILFETLTDSNKNLLDLYKKNNMLLEDSKLECLDFLNSYLEQFIDISNNEKIDKIKFLDILTSVVVLIINNLKSIDE